jgi:HEXXH motif-containing protein
VRTHKLAEATFEELCAGPAGRQAIGALKATQYSQHKLRLHTVLKRISESPEYARATEILTEADDTQPGVIADLLLHPPVGVWLVRALGSDTELGYLNCLAASAAIRANLPFEIDVPVYNGFVCLPTVGAVTASGATATMRGTPDGLAPATRHQTEANGIRLDVRIEDTDPYREFADPIPPCPLGADELSAWRRLLDDAWDILTQRHTAYASELSAGLTTLVPISSGRRVAGASSRAAFGGLYLSTKDNAAKLADVLVHELQHSKLNAVLDLVPMAHDDSEARWYAPWRTDPRPLTGVLHGIYAFTSVVEFWHVERDYLTDPDEAREASLAFAYRRHQVRAAVDNLGHADGLTEYGRRLVDAADLRIKACENAEVPSDIRREVERLTNKDRTDWLSRNQLLQSELHGVGVAVRSD